MMFPLFDLENRFFLPHSSTELSWEIEICYVDFLKTIDVLLRDSTLQTDFVPSQPQKKWIRFKIDLGS